MVTLSLQDVYYIIGILSILCGTSFKIGLEFGKNSRPKKK